MVADTSIALLVYRLMEFLDLTFDSGCHPVLSDTLRLTAINGDQRAKLLVFAYVNS